MTIFDWLSTNDGHTFLLAVVSLLQAGSYYLWWLSHRDRAQLHSELNGHMKQHVQAALDNEREGRDTQ